MLHFIYRDSLVDEEIEDTSSSSIPSVTNTLTAKLLAAADRYDLTRLRRVCESHLCKDISVNSVSRTLALADRYHATELKAVCLRFAAENLAGIRDLIIATCPYFIVISAVFLNCLGETSAFSLSWIAINENWWF